MSSYPLIASIHSSVQDCPQVADKEKFRGISCVGVHFFVILIRHLRRYVTVDSVTFEHSPAQTVPYRRNFISGKIMKNSAVSSYLHEAISTKAISTKKKSVKIGQNNGPDGILFNLAT